MIGHLRGTVAGRTTSSVVVDVHGVGYLVHVPPSETIPAQGQPVELATSLQVREDSMTLYGFAERSSLALFELLISSSGVGPKLALAALGTHRADTLRRAIAGEDVATLTQVPGIGKKVAERLVLELKDKVGVIPALAGDDPSPGAAASLDALADTREALQALGYTAGEIAGALHASGDPAELAELDTAEVVRRALRQLAGGVQDRTRA
ncbi:MAG: Holliday junction branch migration protein RuvA [Nitriliruptoraceae bacterium]|nr:Holliday junction branch migration protein RuvA [Nitriliruptoraceae bacterium]